MQHYEQSYRYSSDSGNDQNSRRESNQSYRSENNRSNNNNAAGVTSTGIANAGIYAQPYIHRGSYTSEKSDGRESNNNAIGFAATGVYAQPYLHRTSYTSEKTDYTKTSKSATGITTQTQRKSMGQQSTASLSNPTIALFGVGSKTSIYFLRHALDAGYHVRAMIIHQAIKDSENLYPRDQQIHSLAKELRDEFSSQESSGTLHWIRADYIYDTNAIRRTIRNAQYVVCMMQNNAPLSSYGVTPTDDGNTKSMKKRQQIHQPTMILPMDPKLCPDPTKPITSFLQILYPLMKMETTIKVFLYQASSIASDVKGKTPIFSKALKTLSTARSLLPAGRQNVCVNFTNSSLHSDHGAAIKEIARHHHRRRNHSGNRFSLGDISNGSSSNYQNNFADSQSKCFSVGDSKEYMDDVAMKSTITTPFAQFAYIITRPTTFLKDGRSIKKVSASKSQPGPFPVTHLDLAEFTLSALRTPKLYNSCPYVVTDSF